MSSRAIILIAVVLGLAAALISFRVIGPSLGGANATSIVVALETVKAGSVISNKDLVIKKWPKSSIPPGASLKVSDILGRVPRQEIYKGEPILEYMLVSKGSRGGLASVIPVGKRAITVHVNEVVAVAGFALPGSYVDVLASVKDVHDKAFSKTVLSRVKVLAVAQETNGDPSKPKVVNAVTLELSPKEAERLDVARSAGALSLTLLNEQDSAVPSGNSGTSYEEVFKDGSSANESIKDSSKEIPRKNKSKNSIISFDKSTISKSDSVELIKGTMKTEINF
jgi:pilus assembly protein CpaB